MEDRRAPPADAIVVRGLAPPEAPAPELDAVVARIKRAIRCVARRGDRPMRTPRREG